MCPESSYFKGSGDKVMKNLKSEYGEKKGKSVFYALANKEKMKPGEHGTKELGKARKK